MTIPFILAIAAQAAAIPGPPPIIVHTVASRRAAAEAGASATTTVDVEVRGGGELLWSGQMRASNRSGASFTRQQANAAPNGCAADDGYDETNERSSLSVNISSIRHGSAEGGMQVRVSWDRPGGNVDCRSRRSTRTVGIAETVLIEPGREQTITGDGGLTIRLRRR